MSFCFCSSAWEGWGVPKRCAFDFCFSAWVHYGHMEGSPESSWGILSVCVGFLGGWGASTVISTFVFQRGAIMATCRVHRSPVGAFCEFLGALWGAGDLQKYNFDFVFLRGEAGEFQRDVILSFVVQRGSTTATWRAHRSPVGASCEFPWAFLGRLGSSNEMSF